MKQITFSVPTSMKHIPSQCPPTWSTSNHSVCQHGANPIPVSTNTEQIPSVSANTEQILSQCPVVHQHRENPIRVLAANTKQIVSMCPPTRNKSYHSACQYWANSITVPANMEQITLTSHQQETNPITVPSSMKLIRSGLAPRALVISECEISIVKLSYKHSSVTNGQTVHVSVD